MPPARQIRGDIKGGQPDSKESVRLAAERDRERDRDAPRRDDRERELPEREEREGDAPAQAAAEPSA